MKYRLARFINYRLERSDIFLDMLSMIEVANADFERESKEREKIENSIK